METSALKDQVLFARGRCWTPWETRPRWWKLARVNHLTGEENRLENRPRTFNNLLLVQKVSMKIYGNPTWGKKHAKSIFWNFLLYNGLKDHYLDEQCCGRSTFSTKQEHGRITQDRDTLLDLLSATSVSYLSIPLTRPEVHHAVGCPIWSDGLVHSTCYSRLESAEARSGRVQSIKRVLCRLFREIQFKRG